ncbi:MAG: phasin family protein [Thermoanaerobaculia bacterium]
MAPKTNAGKLPKDLKESARKIWLAGLGALATAEDQGTKVFQSLVERGEGFETRSEKQLGKVKDQVKNVAGKAEAQWDRVEKFVDEKVSAAVKKLGIPGRDEVKTLTRRVEELTKKVEQLKPQAEKAAKVEKPAKAAKPSAAKAASKTAGKSTNKAA